jgi:hypothetical protein
MYAWSELVESDAISLRQHSSVSFLWTVLLNAKVLYYC